MVVVGGGSSVRFGTDKLLADLDGRPLVQVTVERVVPSVDHVVLVVREEIRETVARLDLGVTIVSGGSTRTRSEFAGLGVLDSATELVGIHDAARPNIRPELIDELFRQAATIGGALPMLELSETLVSKSELAPRTDLRGAQTPQVFRAGPLIASYELARQAGFEGHDTAEVVMEFSSLEVAWVPGDEDNIKVTYPADLDRLRELSRNELR